MIKRIVAAAVLTFCLTSCSADGIKTEKNVKEYDTDFSSVRAEVISFDGFEGKEFEEKINSSIEQSVESDLIAFDSKAQESEEKLRMGNKCVLDISWLEKRNSDGFISIVEERYIYTGGAHGSTVHIPINIDTVSQKQVKLADLFEDEGYVSTLNRMISECVSENADEYSDLWGKAEIKESHQTDFYIEGDKLVIFFQPYDLSYYARGFVEFPLSLEELSGYLKEEYRRLI